MHAIGRQSRRAYCDGAPVHYQRHRPEQTALYRLVQQHAQTFFAQAAATIGVGLRQFVKDEFDAFLECGILGHGFVRLHCADCGHDKRSNDLVSYVPYYVFGSWPRCVFGGWATMAKGSSPR